jgi:hypothetical protein
LGPNTFAYFDDWLFYLHALQPHRIMNMLGHHPVITTDHQKFIFTPAWSLNYLILPTGIYTSHGTVTPTVVSFQHFQTLVLNVPQASDRVLLRTAACLFHSLQPHRDRAFSTFCERTQSPNPD